MAKQTGAIRINADEVATLARALIDAREQAGIDRAEYITQLEANRALLKPRQERVNPPSAGACDLHVPILRYATNALVAREHRALTGVKPFFYVEGRGEVAQVCAPQVEEFLYQQSLKQIKLVPLWRRIIASANEDGTAIVYVRWEQKYQRKLRYEVITEDNIDPDTGEVLERRGKTRATHPLVLSYDGPRVELIPIDMVGTYPAANGDIQAAQGMYLQLSLTGNDLINGKIAGDYDGEGIERLREWSGEVEFAERGEDVNREVTISDASTAADNKFHSRQYDITEWYWRYGNEPNDPAEDYLITIHEPTQTILRAIPNPWGHGERPLEAIYILPPKYGIFGQSLADLAGDMQRFITMMLRLMVDASALRIWPERFWGNGITKDEFERLSKPANRGPGKDHKLNVDDINKAVHAIEIGFDPNTALPILDSLRQWAERATGVTDTMLGKSAPGAQTLGEIESMLAEGQDMVMDMTDMLSVGMTRVGELILALDYEYADSESILELWEMSNQGALVTDPQTGQEVPLNAVTALGQTYDLLAAGSMASTNRAVRKQTSIELFTTMRDDPFVNADPTGGRQWQLRKTLLADAFDQRAPESLIGKEDEAQNIPMIQQVMQAMQVIEQSRQAQGGQSMTDGGAGTLPTGEGQFV